MVSQKMSSEKLDYDDFMEIKDFQYTENLQFSRVFEGFFIVDFEDRTEHK